MVYEHYGISSQSTKSAESTTKDPKADKYHRMSMDYVQQMNERRRRQHPTSMESQDETSPATQMGRAERRRFRPLLYVISAMIFVVMLIPFLPISHRKFGLQRQRDCESVEHGYHCHAQIAHLWGQYSPYWQISSNLTTTPPEGCHVTWVQLLSRHGARYPTKDKSEQYGKVIARLHKRARSYPKPYAFLEHYRYDLGADDLTAFGKREMVHSGMAFFQQYRQLAAKETPFVRSAGQERVVVSAQHWMEGFQLAGPPLHEPMLVIPETSGTNNTLNHGQCPAFEKDIASLESARETFQTTYIPAIQTRISAALGYELASYEVVALMDMCPFAVVADEVPTDATNPFCELFDIAEWRNYDYRESLGKYYLHGPGSELGPTQGVGFVNELIARLLEKPVEDHTSVNHTLDSDPRTFPLNRKIYVDFSHDNDMIHIFSALGLLHGVPSLDRMRRMTLEQMAGYSASHAVPFAGRMVVEKITCSGQQDEKVRILLNGRVWPLVTCAANAAGMCSLSDFIASLEFARNGGHWDRC